MLALLQTLPCLFPVSVYFKNESSEVIRVCLIQGHEQQQNWVLGPGVLAPYLDFFFSSLGLYRMHFLCGVLYIGDL